MPYYLGLDVHQKTSTYCLLDANGKEVRTVEVRGRWDVLLEHLKRMRRRLDDDLVVGFEASLGYGWLYDRLTVFCRKVVVAHPGAPRMIFKAKRKNDRPRKCRREKDRHLVAVGSVARGARAGLKPSAMA